MGFGERLREHRAASGRTVSGIVDALGVSRAAIYGWESEETRPTSENLAALCELYGLDDAARGELLRLLAPHEGRNGDTDPAGDDAAGKAA